MHVAARSDVGMVRSGNEDSFFAHASKQVGLFIVADGMGGHAAGEVASEMAVQIVSRELSDLQQLNGPAPRDRMAESIRNANRAIYERTINESDKQGMGTTVSVLVVSGARWLIGQVGDSRIYLLRDGALTQLTKDHSYVQEQVDAGLLTPDGLTGMVDDRRLQQLLLSRASAGRIVDALIAEANYRGGLDNVTAVVVQIIAADSGDDEKTEEAPALPEGHTPTSSPSTKSA